MRPCRRSVSELRQTKEGVAKGPSLAGHWPGEALERQRVAYQRPLPGLSANGEYVTIIYVGTISLGGN